MSESTRARLVDAAWRCIRDGGLEAATSRAITAAAAANLGAITYHFGSKEALLAEAITDRIEAIAGPALEALESADGDAVSRLHNAIAVLTDGYERSQTDSAAYLEVLAAARRLPLVRDRVAALLDRVRGALSRQLADQVAAGLLPPWVEPIAMAGLLVSVAEGVVLQHQLDERGPDAPSMAAQFVLLLVTARSR